MKKWCYIGRKWHCINRKRHCINRKWHCIAFLWQCTQKIGWFGHFLFKNIVFDENLHLKTGRRGEVGGV